MPCLSFRNCTETLPHSFRHLLHSIYKFRIRLKARWCGHYLRHRRLSIKVNVPKCLFRNCWWNNSHGHSDPLSIID